MSRVYPESGREPAAAEEVEVWWGAYAGRTLLPGFVLCGLVTVGLMGGLYVWGDLEHPNPRYVTYLLVAPLWLVQLAFWAYRLTAYNYRLTTHRLFCARSFSVPAAAVPLAQVTRVKVAHGLLEQLLGVGRIVVYAGGPPLVLEGVKDPEQVAGLIREQVAQVETANSPED